MGGAGAWPRSPALARRRERIGGQCSGGTGGGATLWRRLRLLCGDSEKLFRKWVGAGRDGVTRDVRDQTGATRDARDQHGPSTWRVSSR